VHPLVAVIGNVILSEGAMVSHFAAIRGDEGQPLFVGDDSNVQDGAMIHAMETFHHGKPVKSNQVEAGGKNTRVTSIRAWRKDTRKRVCNMTPGLFRFFSE
jgi:carbonic anhydrase